MDNRTRLENARIVDIGLHYLGHYRRLSVRAELATRLGRCIVTIPQSKLPKLMDMLNDELDGKVEDGVFIYELKGKPVRVLFDGTDHAVGLGDILCSEDEVIMLKD